LLHDADLSGTTPQNDVQQLDEFLMQRGNTQLEVSTQCLLELRLQWDQRGFDFYNSFRRRVGNCEFCDFYGAFLHGEVIQCSTCGSIDYKTIDETMSIARQRMEKNSDTAVLTDDADTNAARGVGSDKEGLFSAASEPRTKISNMKGTSVHRRSRVRRHRHDNANSLAATAVSDASSSAVAC